MCVYKEVVERLELNKEEVNAAVPVGEMNKYLCFLEEFTLQKLCSRRPADEEKKSNC